MGTWQLIEIYVSNFSVQVESMLAARGGNERAPFLMLRNKPTVPDYPILVLYLYILPSNNKDNKIKDKR